MENKLDLKVTITEIDVSTFPWEIPDFRVLTISLRKAKFIGNEQEMVGLVNKNAAVALGDVICVNKAKINKFI